MLKVFVTGADDVNWATAEDYLLIKQAIGTFAIITDEVSNAQVIHSVNWHSLLSVPHDLLAKTYVITHIPHDVRHMLTQPAYVTVAPYVNLWIAPSTKAEKYLAELKFPHEYVPYPIDTTLFKPLIKTDSAILNIRAMYSLPQNSYLIGSFQRDTEGEDLVTPKYIKGPDILVAMIKEVHKTNPSICVVLAGPRRFWIIKQLQKAGIEYRYIGQEVTGDDIAANTLDRTTMNLLYNLIDLYIVSSRMEGGPKAVLEAAATQCKIISTDVGQARDVLIPEVIYTSIPDAVKLIDTDIKKNQLIKTVKKHTIAVKKHCLSEITKQLLHIYQKIPG